MAQPIGCYGWPKRKCPTRCCVFLADGNALVLGTRAAGHDPGRAGVGVSPSAARRHLRQRPRHPGQDRRRACRASAAKAGASSTWAWRAAATRCSAASTRGSRRPRWWRPCKGSSGPECGPRSSALLGLGGTELSAEHAEETGRVVSAMDPEYFSMLTVMLIPGTELYRQWRQGTFELPEPEDLLRRTAAGHRALRRPFPLRLPHQPCLELPAAGGNAVARQSRAAGRH